MQPQLSQGTVSRQRCGQTACAIMANVVVAQVECCQRGFGRAGKRSSYFASPRVLQLIVTQQQCRKGAIAGQRVSQRQRALIADLIACQIECNHGGIYCHSFGQPESAGCTNLLVVGAVGAAPSALQVELNQRWIISTQPLYRIV
eukprot:56246-Rhodomonas_salina.1